MRGFKKDSTETIARQWLDGRSFVSMPKVIPNCKNLLHLLLYGDDKRWQRENIWRNAAGRCERCGVRASLAGEHPGEWSHKAVKPADRCDCIEAAEWLCSKCHAKIHANRRPKWTKKS